MKVVCWPLYEMTLFVPEHDVTSAGTINFSCLFETVVNLVTSFPQTETLRPVDELMGKPVPVTVASTPPPGLVCAGEKLTSVMGSVVAGTPELSA